MGGVPALGALEELPKQPPSLIQVAAQNSPAAVEEVEITIQELSEPIDQEQINRISGLLSRLEDLNERDRPQEMLAERIALFTKTPAPRNIQASATPELVAGDFWTYDALLVRIEMLNLGPHATVDDLRGRDQLVSIITGIRDPVTREKLLTRLEERERTSEGVTEEP
jgi:hypothetical protein